MGAGHNFLLQEEGGASLKLEISCRQRYTSSIRFKV